MKENEQKETRLLQAQIDRDLHTRIKVLAVIEGTTVKDLVIEAMTARLASAEAQAKQAY